MSSDPIDIDALLQPISDAQPTGLPLRDESSGAMRDFYDARDAASEARLLERKLATYIPPPPGEEDPYKPEPPDWDIVLSRCVDLLTSKSKDLWVVAWLIEALCRLQGFPGLRDGFQLARRLCEQYWDDLHPGGPRKDFENLVAQLAGLNGIGGEGTLIDPIKAIPITSGKSLGPYSFADFMAAATLEQETDPQRRQNRIEDGEATTEQFEAAVAESTGTFYEDLLATIDQAIDEFERLNQFLEARCVLTDSHESCAPPSSNITNTLADIRRRVALCAEEHEPEEAREAGQEASMTTVVHQNSTMASGPVASRDDAFNAILNVADFFQKTEPHSPVSYGLRQVVRWGRLSLPELLIELIDNEETRDQLFRHVGIEKPAEPEEE